MGYSYDKYTVKWRVPGRKKPIVGSSTSTSGFIVAIAKDGSTIQQLRDKFGDGKEYSAVLGEEAIAVLDAYIKRGYGDVVARDWFF